MRNDHSTCAKVVREAIEAIGMCETLNYEEHKAWMAVARNASESSLIKLWRMLKP